ncbi:hypothetical protein DFS34DRAFT_303178 [Phlyctochytrium arcticum]|nr:hypothetical protein DFS34DRAFT_303178 [Phlyctochytrium arcticum]
METVCCVVIVLVTNIAACLSGRVVNLGILGDSLVGHSIELDGNVDFVLQSVDKQNNRDGFGDFFFSLTQKFVEFLLVLGDGTGLLQAENLQQRGTVGSFGRIRFLEEGNQVWSGFGVFDHFGCMTVEFVLEELKSSFPGRTFYPILDTHEPVLQVFVDFLGGPLPTEFRDALIQSGGGALAHDGHCADGWLDRWLFNRYQCRKVHIG